MLETQLKKQNKKLNKKLRPMKAEDFTIKPILKSMIASRLISSDEATRIFSNFKDDDKKHLNPLVAISNTIPSSKEDSNKKLSLNDLCEWAASEAGVEYYHIDPLKIDVGPLMDIVSYDYSEQNSILPIKVDGDNVVFATSKPQTAKWQNELEQLLNREVSFVFSNPKDIDHYRGEFYALAQSIAKSKGAESQGDIRSSLDQLVELGRTGQLDAEHHHVIQVVDWLLQYAFDQRASDIHLEPRKERGEIRFRIDGVLQPVYQVPPNVMLAMTSRLKTLGRMDISERRRPQDGRLKTRKPDGSEIELRLSSIQTAQGEKMVMRIFDPEVLQRNFSDLGITQRELDIWGSLTKRTHGIVLVTGPTGSGKTTTLYSTLRKLATSEMNVCTIEDPIEMVEPKFNQMQVHHAIGLDFAAGVRALLRQDPDIIMVGEIRDLETAEMAIQASLTGHLVLATLHTNDACSAVIRLQELGIPGYLINASVLGVMAQRLVRKLCPHCKTPTPIDADAWKQATTGWEIDASKSEHAEGCLECRQTGYQGRIGLYEMMELSPECKAIIDQGGTLDMLQAQSVKDGCIPLKIAGFKKVAEGLTSMDEVFRVAPI